MSTAMKRAFVIMLGIQTIALVVLFVPQLGLIPQVILSISSISILSRQLLKGRARETAIDLLVEKRVIEKTRELRKKMAHFEQQAMTDALTGLLNRRGGEDSIEQQVARSRRVNTAFSFVLIDIDLFKKINDRYGHATGDLVISGIANAIKENLRTSDFAVRWGGEEYLVCLPDTNLKGALVAAEKLRSIVERLDFDITPVTISLGCAELGGDSFHVALARADMNLYFAKSKGRNQVFPNSLEKMLDRF